MKEDLICYLDDDNRYTPEHCAVLAAAAQNFPEVEFFYTLRWFENLELNFLCEDNTESLGFWKIPPQGIAHRYGISYFERGFMVDVNCMAMRRDLAKKSASLWCQSLNNDAFLFQALCNRVKMMNTAARTVYYRIDFRQYCKTNKPADEKILLEICDDVNQGSDEKPWLRPTLALPSANGIVLQTL